jgi:uncharacterized UPF0160 family protein
MKKIITHNGDFHADDVFAVATTEIYLEKQGLVLGKDFEIVRTGRDQDFSWVSEEDIIMDVGFIYSEEKNKFDHHQASFQKFHKIQNIPYASFGLVWDKFGLEICNNNEDAFSEIERKLVLQIDGVDNGVATSQGKYENIPPFTWDLLVRSFYTSIEDEEFLDKFKLEEKFLEGFLKIKNIAKEFLLGMIQRENGISKKKIELLEFLKDEKNTLIINTKNHNNVKILIIPKKWSWKYAYLLPENHNFHFVIYPDIKNDFRIHGLRKSFNDMAPRIMPPTEWLGKKEKDLEEISGINSFTFCHKGGFLMSGKSKEIMLEVIKNI